MKRLFVEYHSSASEDQTLPEILTLLKASGYRLHIQTGYCSQSPFAEVVTSGGMDLCLNMFAIRN